MGQLFRSWNWQRTNGDRLNNLVTILRFRGLELLGPFTAWRCWHPPPPPDMSNCKENVHHLHNTDHGLVVHQENGPGRVALLLLSGELLHVRVKTETKKTSRISPCSRRQPGRSEDHCWRPPRASRGRTRQPRVHRA